MRAIWPHATKSAPSSTPSLGRRSRSGARFDLLFGWPGYAGLNSVPSRSMACMMMARRRASDPRLAHGGPLGDRKGPVLELQRSSVARQHDVCGFVQEGAHPPVAALRDAPGVVDLARLIAPRY